MYSGKRLAVIEDLPEAARVSEYEHNIYALWKIILGRYIHMYDVYVQGIGIGRDPASAYPADRNISSDTNQIIRIQALPSATKPGLRTPNKIRVYICLCL